MHTVSLDVGDKILECIIGGLLSPIEVQTYINKVQNIVIENHLHRGYRLIVDVSDCIIQTQETIAAFSRHIVAMPKADRIAVIVGGSLASGQVRRLFTQQYVRLVSSRQQAIDWITSNACVTDNTTPTRKPTL